MESENSDADSMIASDTSEDEGGATGTRSPSNSTSEVRRSKSPSPSTGDVLENPVLSAESGSPRGDKSPTSPVRNDRPPSPARSPEVRTPPGSPSRTPPGAPSPGRSPAGSPQGSPSERRSLSRSPERRSSPTGSLSRSPTGHSRGSPVPRSPPGSYSRRSHIKKIKHRSGDDGQLSDASDDGRSNISSNSSYNMGTPDSQERRPRLQNGEGDRKMFEPHKAEDLSDVSDLDSAAGSLDSVSDDEGDQKKNKIKSNAHEPNASERQFQSPASAQPTQSIRKDIVSQSDEMEQLDFEAEEPQGKEDREEGECAEVRRPESSINDAKSEVDDDGELKGDEVEEGEITDEDENRPEETEPRPICRFYNRGQCTWGSSCRFLHPGVTDKGNYTMFDMVRPLVPANGPPMYSPMMDYRAPMERPVIAPMGPTYAPSRKEGSPMVESAWERGLRTAKEMMRKASKRKETDMDFEEKKMNLSLGQDELDKENDYYTRPASPAGLEDELDRWSDKEAQDGKHHRVAVPDRHDSMDPYYSHHRETERWSRSYYEGDMRMEYGRSMSYDSRRPLPHSHMAYRAQIHSSAHHGEAPYLSEKYERKKKSHTVREVIVSSKSSKPWKDERSASGAHRARGDEWNDPWMRSKSPTARKSRTSRRQSYSSGSSYSSSRSSRSYSSSYSRSASRSRSRSKSRSHSLTHSRSRSPHPETVRRPGPGRSGYRQGGSPGVRQRRTSDLRVRGGRDASPRVPSEKRSAADRGAHPNPPAPVSRKRPPSPASGRKVPAQGSSVLPGGRGTERKSVGGKVRRSKSSRSSSSESSGSSSDSSESSGSSSSSSRDPTPPPKTKNVVIDERLHAQSTKIKAMDALKVSGQKQQIKLTLKAPGSSVSALADNPRKVAVIAGKKRPLESTPSEPIETPPSGTAASGGASANAKKTTSRREELLKQLKAVEDAIARKRSKIS